MLSLATTPTSLSDNSFRVFANEIDYDPELAQELYFQHDPAE